MSKKDKIDALVEDSRRFNDIDPEDFRSELETLDDAIIDYAYLCMIFSHNEE